MVDNKVLWKFEDNYGGFVTVSSDPDTMAVRIKLQVSNHIPAYKISVNNGIIYTSPRSCSIYMGHTCFLFYEYEFPDAANIETVYIYHNDHLYKVPKKVLCALAWYSTTNNSVSRMMYIPVFNLKDYIVFKYK